MLKKSALALCLAAQFGICHAAIEALPPVPTNQWHVSVQAPGKAKQDRVVDDRFVITYTSRLVEFQGQLPDASIKALAADGKGYKVVSTPGFSTLDNQPAWIANQQEIHVPKETVRGNTRTLQAVPITLGTVIMVDPLVADRKNPDTVLTRLYLNHTELAGNKSDGAPVSANPHAEDKLKVGDKQLITWSLNGRNYGLELQLTSITDNLKK